jgi:hypothetical protein
MKEKRNTLQFRTISNEDMSENLDRRCGVCKKEKREYGLDLKAFPYLNNYDTKYEEVLEEAVNSKGFICAECYKK